MADEHKHTNRLAEEQSPYLLQHAHNPVDWYPWGEDAFEKARSENKPIFLSVGYSTCHWCHVMERESFESEEIAEVMNRHFVNIKVDREERADVDRVYMTYVQATSGGGGWPMSVFLTPQLQPFFGATYFPPEGAYGRPGFKDVLLQLSNIWNTKRDLVLEQTADVMKQLQAHTKPAKLKGTISDSAAAAAIDSCSRMLSSRFDAKLGGFGKAPKFPRPAEINALLTDHLRASAATLEGTATVQARRALHEAVFTLQRMAAGGMHDHVGGGFHRYSVDDHWHVPHFEKMLYDNPQLANTYLVAFQITGDAGHAREARDILDYLIRDMRHPDGGFFSAEDADSMAPGGEKKEGAFYLWSESEINEVLGEERSAVFKKHYYVKPSGNTDLSPASDPHHEFTGLNVLIERQPLSQTAADVGLRAEDVDKILAESRELLHKRRAERPRPHLDDKVVTAWNGMAISAFATAARVLASEPTPPVRRFPVEGRPAEEYLTYAQQAAQFVRDKLWDADKQRLHRSCRTSVSAAEGYADDYAYLISGLLDLFQADANPEWLQWAVQLQEVQDRLFWDDVGGGYFSTTGDDPSVLLRMKEEYDGAEPAASSIAAANLFRLAALSTPEQGQKDHDRGVKTTSAFAGRLDELALAMPQMCCSLYLQAAGHLRQVVIAGKRGDEKTEALLNAAHSTFTPDKVVIPIDPSQQAQADYWKQHNPEAWSMVEAHTQKHGDTPTAFVCQNFTCQAPTDDPARLQQLLKESSRPGGASWGVPTPTPVDISSLTGKGGGSK